MVVGSNDPQLLLCALPIDPALVGLKQGGRIVKRITGLLVDLAETVVKPQPTPPPEPVPPSDR